MMPEEKKYDGLTINKDGKHTTTSFNIAEALDQDNIRNLVLNGQLFVEMECDSLLSCYFVKKRGGLRFTAFHQFLISPYTDFRAKIEFLKMMEVWEENERTQFIDKKVIVSLKAIGAVRNAFHHNLDHDEALLSLTSGDKFAFLGKPLDNYGTVEELAKDFKSETHNVYMRLHELSQKLAEIDNMIGK